MIETVSLKYVVKSRIDFSRKIQLDKIDLTSLKLSNPESWLILFYPRNTIQLILLGEMSFKWSLFNRR